MLGVSVRIDMSIVTELASKMDLAPVGGDIDQIATVQPCPLDVRMSEAAVRLVASLRSPNDAAILGPGIIREIIYHGLSGPHGQVLVEMLSKGSAASKIRAALEWIHNEYAKPLSVPTMADTFGMSISAFHHSFKQVAGASPLQYLKSVRLHKARLFIKYDGLGAAVTAAKVGYESPSQFSRDFKRFFGHPPNREVVRMKALVGADGPEEVFASSSPQYDGRA
ncbi:AraC-like DNA-binding protein [Silvibacterium bohemicum]|uniref:AraC-like DNA-binding protein n=2 Tax=Silvibacterium bohemicum TaxID=1577686 RepID=A0A841K188_9BACT|nr:AraC-like DNA-binding protein [Silvibacterium bohemicum]